MESSHARSMDFFKEVLDNAHFQVLSDQYLDFAPLDKKISGPVFESEI